MNLYEQWKRLRSGEIRCLPEKDKDELARLLVDQGLVEEAVRALATNQSYSRVLEIAKEWAPRLGVPQIAFRRARKGLALGGEDKDS